MIQTKIIKKSAPFGAYYKLRLCLSGVWYEAINQKSAEKDWASRVNELTRSGLASIDLQAQPEKWRKI